MVKANIFRLVKGGAFLGMVDEALIYANLLID
ncbi:hypothetical protein SAMN05444008_105132 [Cnuella takakiae]|uniref:Uncharacterized protein n=1 Tax=Cnuella takakiae TaxID=1302690 RepID=A0A1M4Z8S6_9BACT|nr:hypothetical protein SAMN05444008_105132 [Cnuella takakiae]